jgi:hypothetical protein
MIAVVAAIASFKQSSSDEFCSPDKDQLSYGRKGGQAASAFFTSCVGY